MLPASLFSGEPGANDSREESAIIVAARETDINSTTLSFGGAHCCERAGLLPEGLDGIAYLDLGSGPAVD